MQNSKFTFTLVVARKQIYQKQLGTAYKTILCYNWEKQQNENNGFMQFATTRIKIPKRTSSA